LQKDVQRDGPSQLRDNSRSAAVGRVRESPRSPLVNSLRGRTMMIASGLPALREGDIGHHGDEE
jgi:hypothetical protein